MEVFLKSYMREVKLADTVFVWHLFFWLTVIFIRGLGLFQQETVYPHLTVFGVVMYYSVLGAILIFLSAVFFFKNKFLLTIFLGIGTGLIVNDFFTVMFSLKQQADYWQYANLFFISLFGIIPVIWLRKNYFDSPNFVFLNKLEKHKNPDNPYVSVVVPAYNEGKFIHNTLGSLLAQTFRDFELIVVDNNSSDNTVEMAKKFGAKVIIVREKGVARARNTGFIEAKGEIVLSTDSDTVVPENWVEKIISEYRKDNSLVGFGGLSCLYSGPVAARAASRFIFPKFWIVDRIFSGGWNMVGFNMSVRKDAFLKIKGFNTKLQMNEDVDLSKRLRNVGKVKIDTRFSVYSSGRRFKNGLILGTVTYVPSWVLRTVFKKDVNFAFPTVRTENSVLQKLRFVPLGIGFIFLVALFYNVNSSLLR